MAAAEGAGADWRLAAICLSLLVGVFGALIFLMVRSPKEEEEEEKKPTAGQRKRGALDRMQRGAARGAATGAEDEEGEEEEEGDRAARRSAQKEQKKQEKKAGRQAAEQARANVETAKTEKQKKYEERQKEKEAEYAKRDEEERKAREEKEKKEKEEFEKWKEMFSVEAEGEDDASVIDESAVERFLSYVKRRKVVNLEDLAAEFKMKTSVAIDRLEQLQKLGRLSGIFDDRGKYIYISTEEMSAVADWLKKKGRINRPDLIAACNRLVRLNPTEEDKAALEQEAKSAADSLEEEATEGATAGSQDS